MTWGSTIVILSRFTNYQFSMTCSYVCMYISRLTLAIVSYAHDIVIIWYACSYAVVMYSACI